MKLRRKDRELPVTQTFERQPEEMTCGMELVEQRVVACLGEGTAALGAGKVALEVEEEAYHS